MAFDISLGESAPQAHVPNEFREFHAAHADVITRALAVACDDADLANDATLVALARASQRWRSLRDHPNLVGWVIHAGLQHADTTLRDRPPASVNRATGGYVRGLDLEDAVAALPLLQRAALVTGYLLGWSDRLTAAGFDTPVEAMATRRERAVSFVAHHLHRDESEVVPLIQAHLGVQKLVTESGVPDIPAVRRRARRRTARNRTTALLLAVAVIIAGGALFRTGTQSDAVTGPQPVDGPRTSANWFDPVSDGGGNFVALNTRGSSKFVRSTDGSEWFEVANWNSRAVDLRTEVTAFARANDRYVAVIETNDAVSDFLAPRIALSRNLRDWDVRQLDVSAPTPVDGLRRGYQVVGSASANGLVLVALESTEEFDFRLFDVQAGDVCAESVTATERRYFLCDATTSIIVDLNGEQSSQTVFYLAADGEAFRQVSLPANTAPRSLIGFGGGFAVADANRGQVWVSPNGIDWERATTSPRPNRFVLLEGDSRGALVIEPDATGWTSHVIAPTGLGVSGDIPLTIAPSGVWSQPDVASGPAGWALFVTTSRPWERVGDVSGWAVATPSWIVSQLPDAPTITAQSVPDGPTLRVAADGPWVRTSDDGTIVLLDPNDNTVMVQVTQQQIDDARPTDLGDARVKAHVFFSPDGVSWRSVWSSTDDTWSGSVAVGDDEILLSGTQLTGTPITIDLDDES